MTTVLALSAVLLAGCSAGSSPASEAGPGAPVAQPQFSTGGSAADSAGGGVVKGANDIVIGPRIVTTVQLTVTVDKPIAAADAAARIVDKFGGTVANRSETAATNDAPGSAQLTLRIPSAQLTKALEEIKALGVAQGTSINSTDVTAQSEDIDARITALQTSVDRLLTLMTKATSTDNLLAIESALSQRQADLESLQAQKRSLDDQVQLSTVNLSLISQKDTPAETPDTFWSGLIAGWSAFIGFWSAVLVAVGVLVPWIIAAGIIALVVVTWVKLAKTRKARKAAQIPAP